jgi:hypothetical protein
MMFGQKRPMPYCQPECDAIDVCLEEMIAASPVDPQFEKPFNDEEEL